MAERGQPSCYVCGSAGLAEGADPRNPLCSRCLPAREHVVSMQRETGLPGVLAEIAAVAGEKAALAIADARGGTQAYFPPEPSEEHWLSRLIGRDAAKRVCEHLTCGVGGMRVDLPLGPAGHAARARAKVDALIAEGRSERDIALATGYSIRGVRRRRAKQGAPKDDPQLSLI